VLSDHTLVGLQPHCSACVSHGAADAVAAPLQSTSWPGTFNATSSNEYLDEIYKFKTPRVLEARARGSACFDFDFYLKQNPDLKPLWGKPLAIWRHFVYYGQFDARPHK